MIYELVSENLTQLGGRMGTEKVTTNFRKLFSSLQRAKRFAEKDYEKNISWILIKGGFRSPDFGYVIYYIYKKEIN